MAEKNVKQRYCIDSRADSAWSVERCYWNDDTRNWTGAEQLWMSTDDLRSLGIADPHEGRVYVVNDKNVTEVTEQSRKQAKDLYGKLLKREGV